MNRNSNPHHRGHRDVVFSRCTRWYGTAFRLDDDDPDDDVDDVDDEDDLEDDDEDGDEDDDEDVPETWQV